MIGRIVVPLVVAAAMAGCWTFNETEYPVEETTAAATNLYVAVVGYKAMFTDYEAVTGYSSVYVPGWYGYRYYRPGHFETVASTAYIPLRRESDAYLVRAKERLRAQASSSARRCLRWRWRCSSRGRSTRMGT